MRTILRLMMLLTFVLAGCAPQAIDPTDRPLSAELRADVRTGMQAENRSDYHAPKAGIWESADYRYSDAKSLVISGTRTSGTFIGTAILRGLIFAIAAMTILLIPGLVFGSLEVVLEGIVLMLCGGILLATGWPAALHETSWVWWCLMIPGFVLFVFGWAT